MKAKKIVALLLSTTMLLGAVAGCSKVKKVSSKSMDKAAEKVEANQYDYDEMDDLDRDDLEDGIYVSISSDDIEDAIEEFHFDEDEIDDAIDMINDILDADIEFELDDVQEASAYVRIDDDNMAVVVYVDVGESNIGSEAFRLLDESQEDAQDMLEDAADEIDVDMGDFELNLDDLSGSEYYNGKNSGYIKLCLTAEVLEDIIENDLEDALEEYDVDVDDDILDIIEDAVDDIPFDIAAGGIYYNGGKIVFTGIVSDDEDFIADYEAFMKTIGLDSPTKVKPSKYFRKLIATGLAGACAYLDTMMSYSYDYADFF